MIGCKCDVCLSEDPRDKRLRTGLMIETDEQYQDSQDSQNSSGRAQRLIVDTSADFRQQALRENLDRLDAVLITHCHADHVMGLDDIRPFNFRHGPIPLYASETTWKGLRRVFGYIFETTYTGGGLPQIIPHTVNGAFDVCGMRVTPFDVIHGSLNVTGFRFSYGHRDVAFITDCNSIPAESLAKLRGLDLLIIDALQIKPHPTHLHLEQTLNYIADLRPRRALLTHMGHNFKHAELCRILPDGVEPAYDGLRLEI